MTGQAAAEADDGRDPFAAFGLDTLLAGAARLRPDAIAFADDDEALTTAQAAARAAALARLLVEYGLRPGERLLISGGAGAAVCVALIAGLRAGFDLALAPLDLDAGALAAFARAVGATGLIGVGRYGDHRLAETYLAAARDAPNVRLVAALGPDEIDGMADLRPAAIAAFAAAAPNAPVERGRPLATATPHLLTLARAAGPVLHRQSTLMAAGLDLVTRAKIGRRTPLLTTLPPVSFAGLVAGPVAALLAGGALHLHGPFAADRFVRACASSPLAHVVVPAAAAAAVVEAGLTEGLASLVVCARSEAPPPALPRCACPVIDLYAIGERAAVPEPRIDGHAVAAAAAPHHVSFDGQQLLAVTSDGPGGALRGAAVTMAAE